MRLFGRIILFALAGVGSIALLLAALGLWAAVNERQPQLPKRIVLELNLDAGVIEVAPNNPFAKLGADGGYVLKDIVEILNRAADDPRVTGVVAKLESARFGMARSQELRDAIQAFRKSGKRTVVFSTSLGGDGGGTIPYYLASAFQEIWLQPSGDIGMTGFLVQSPFVKGTLDLLNIQAQFGARYEYKSAIEMFTQDKFTKENKQSLQQLIDSWTRQTLAGIAQARNLTPEKVQGLIDHAPPAGGRSQGIRLGRPLGLLGRVGKSADRRWDEIDRPCRLRRSSAARAECRQGGADLRCR